MKCGDAQELHAGKEKAALPMPRIEAGSAACYSANLPQG
jgi:hypothetical protein